MTPDQLRECFKNRQLGRAANCDREIERIIDRLRRNLRIHALDKETSMDIVSEALAEYCKALADGKYLDSGPPPLRLLLGISRNIVMDYFKKQERQRRLRRDQLEGEALDAGMPPAYGEHDAPEVQLPTELWVQQCLSDEERMVMDMRYGIDGYPSEFIGEHLGMTRSKVEEVIRGGRRKIKTRLRNKCSEDQLKLVRAFMKTIPKVLNWLIENKEDLERLRMLFKKETPESKKEEIRTWIRTKGKRYLHLVTMLGGFKFLVQSAEVLEFVIPVDQEEERWHAVEGYFFGTLSAEELEDIEIRSSLDSEWGSEFELEVSILAMLRCDSLLEREG